MLQFRVGRFVVVAAALCAVSAQAGQLTPAQKASDYDTLHALFDSNYAMRWVKKDLIGLDFDKVWTDHRDAAINAPTDGDFMAELQKTVGEFHDAHVALVRPSDQSAKLGFRVDKFGTQAIITEIDRKALPADVFPLSVGDELLTIDGEPVAAIAARNAALRRGASTESELGNAYITLTARSGHFLSIPKGDAALTFKTTDGKAVALSLPWIRKGRPLGDESAKVALHAATRGPGVLRPYWIDVDGQEFSADSQAIRFELPVPSNVVKINADPLAYVFSTPKGPMGFVRIDTFLPDDTAKALEAYKGIFQKLQILTNGVVIDLRGNGGGSIEYGYQLASLLISQPEPAETAAWRVTPSRILEFRSGVAAAKSAAEKADDLYLINAIEEAFSQGKPMTDFMPFLTGNTVVPDASVNYSHPVELLIDDQCYSMCDFFSALMQDTRRAVLVGVPTGAAGGPVDEFAPLPYSNVTPHITIGVGKRSNGSYIENRPVQPDVSIPMQADDVADGYAKYRSAALKVLLDQVK